MHSLHDVSVPRPRRYYRCFIQDYSAIAEPLSWLLRKEGFKWTAEVEGAFRVLQLTLTRAPML
jgi:hypothetical protein